MSSRSYLSIGDVLTLLRQEFPDVTISKIRFLESQGLVNPERTPSGYRKFYEHDVERLRWVLRQQREHFLPLKVIKDRLDDDSVPAEAGASTPATSGTPASADAEARSSASAGGHHADEPVLVGQRVSADAGAGPSAEAPGGGSMARAAGGAMLPGIETSYNAAPPPAPGRPNSSAATGGPVHNVPAVAAAPPRLDVSGRSVAAETAPVPPGETVPAPAADAAPGAAADAAPAPITDAASGPVSGQASGPASGPSPEPASGGQGAPASDLPSPTGGSSRPPRRAKTTPGRHTGAVPSAGAPAAPEPAPAATPEPVPTGAGGPADPAGIDGASMSVEELSASCGLDVSVLVELQEYGLLSSSVIAGLEYFDEEALAVAMVAAQFARFGIEPRHLRLYKNAAEREAGFVEQIVLPLVRQRNPEARARAHEMVDELSRLGEQLRGALLRNALRDLLDG